MDIYKIRLARDGLSILGAAHELQLHIIPLLKRGTSPQNRSSSSRFRPQLSLNGFRAICITRPRISLSPRCSTRSITSSRIHDRGRNYDASIHVPRGELYMRCLSDDKLLCKKRSGLPSGWRTSSSFVFPHPYRGPSPQGLVLSNWRAISRCALWQFPRCFQFHKHLPCGKRSVPYFFFALQSECQPEILQRVS